MSILTRLFGRSDVEEATANCPHTAAVPRWDNPGDIGREELASRFLCDACGESFTPAEFRRLRESEAGRLRQQFGDN